VLAVLAVAGATTACTPEEVAKMAISQYWGSNSACAEKVVYRESRFQADAVNPSSGTTGLFQLHPVHAPWIKRTFGYEFHEMKDPFKNSEVAKALSAEAYRMYRDGWQPWRYGGQRIPGGGCPA
jgi:soluble lytic murein transglycosylase-like protein